MTISTQPAPHPPHAPTIVRPVGPFGRAHSPTGIRRLSLHTGLRRRQWKAAARTRKERALKDSEERYRIAVESWNDGIALVRDDKYIFANRRLLERLGCDAKDIVNKPFLAAIHPDDREMVARYALKRERGEQAPSRYEFRGVTKDGTTRCIEASVARVAYRGEPAGLVYFRDVTERKKDEEALKESESRFRGAFEASGVGMVLVALDGRWLKVNESLCTILGYSEAQLLARTFQSITHPDDLKNDLEYVQKLIDNQIPYYRLEKRYYHRDGYIVWGALSVSLVRDARGYPLHFVGQIEDMTERKLLEEKIQTLLITDELTGLYNRRGFFELASEELIKGSGKDHVLFFVNVDHMKWINDTLGHMEGDAALVAVAGLLRNTFREPAIVGRTGGVEFAILAAGVTEAGQEVLLARLQHNIERFNIAHAPNFPISLSVGYACYEPGNPCRLEALFAEADDSMYQRRQAGQEAIDISSGASAPAWRNRKLPDKHGRLTI